MKVVKLRNDGSVEMVEVGESMYDTLKKIVGGCVEMCYSVLPWFCQNLVMVVNENGYALGLPVNRTGTAIYNKSYDANHYILGHVAVVKLVNRGEDDEAELVGFDECEEIAVEAYFRGFATAAKSLQIPDPLPKPRFTVKGFDSAEEMLDFLKGNAV